MRIAIDARELDERRTGVGRYLAEILGAWQTSPAASRHEFIRLAPSSAVNRTLWEQTTLPRLTRAAGADVLFAPAYTGPVVSPVPLVLTIHDVSFAARPEWFTWRDGLRRRTLTRLAARRATRVLTDSEFSRGEIVERLRVARSKVDVIPLGVTAVASGERRPGNAILFVGSVFNRRHVPELMQGFARLARRRDVRLEIVGGNQTLPWIDLERIAADTGVANAISIRSYVSEAELGTLYSTASVFAYLSEYEGFGLTPLEALATGIPIVVLDTPVAREVYGPAATYVPTVEPAIVEAALERAMYDEDERRRVLSEAPAVLARYSWQRCAERVLEVLVACGEASSGARRRPGLERT